MALGLSLAGSLHCAGMCGGFAILVRTKTGKSTVILPFSAYAAGKSIIYAALGMAVGLVGGTVESISVGADVLAWVAGLLMILVGLHLSGWELIGTWISPPAGPRFVGRFASVIQTDSVGARFLMGMLNGLLPCGLLYAALAMSLSQASAVGGGLFMLIFGLGTIPSLLLVSHLGSLLSADQRGNLSRYSGWFVILLGLLTIVRGTGLIESTMSHM